MDGPTSVGDIFKIWGQSFCLRYLHRNLRHSGNTGLFSTYCAWHILRTIDYSSKLPIYIIDKGLRSFERLVESYQLKRVVLP